MFCLGFCGLAKKFFARFSCVLCSLNLSLSFLQFFSFFPSIIVALQPRESRGMILYHACYYGFLLAQCHHLCSALEHIHPPEPGSLHEEQLTALALLILTYLPHLKQPHHMLPEYLARTGRHFYVELQVRGGCSETCNCAKVKGLGLAIRG
ncbi:hypothetical protein HOY80DRAFT_972342 [Tuber brumale]|nr:hypothetical protein HOY80DRAFT_972342 [Tuber brumale]